jgi:3-oxoadipate enol-lactonase
VMEPAGLPAFVRGEGIPLVLLHAFPVDGWTWENQVQALSDRYQVIVPDLRGFGRAADLAEEFQEISINLAADDVARTLDDLDIASAVIGGISRGGYIAMAFARRYASRLRGLMLFDTRATPETEQGKKNWEEMAERLEREGAGFLPEKMRDRLFGKSTLSSRPEIVRKVEEIILSQKPRAVAAAARGMSTRDDARPGLADIRVPVICLAGMEDGAFEETRAIADAIPGAQFVEIPRAGHLPILEQPDLTNAAIRDFLASAIPETACLMD